MASVRRACDSSVLLTRGGESGEGTDGSAKRTPVADLLETEEAKGLLESGRVSGSLSADEIALALDELELDAAQLDDFYTALDELHIEVVNAAEVAKPEVEIQIEQREISTDSLQLFLKDIGRVDLLT